ncbi:autotransporter outer membrane beta-barrel domain-containing protein [Tenebrionicola larvae]|jgi:autotransporter family porin|uniref:Autotransporter outer membrane beta-barrel domain-containing protein n=1 Tax=Tenebrionicola larvae TaxID=2815733 RepID=A0A949Q4W1_9ENTR|nr:autotransporter outer membrane beta-barrel domain-containing protein [Tenebrionicola larvae]MBV5096235.1 autotransporter outer membrane beta-barrel domain-containing protein [Tenebrionicola larvae]
MSWSPRIPFPHNKVFAGMCLMALPAAPAMAAGFLAGTNETISVSKSYAATGVGDVPLTASGAGATIETTGNFLNFNSTMNSTSVASAKDGGALIINSNTTLTGSGSTADTVALNNGNLTAAEEVTITSSGAGSWGINAANGSQVSLDSSDVNASGSSDGAVSLGNGSMLNANKSKINSSDKATGLLLKADSTDAKASAVLTKTKVGAQNNHAISIVNGDLQLIAGSSANSSGENSNAINAGAGATVTVSDSNISTQGNGGEAILLTDASSTLTAQNTTIVTSGDNANAIRANAGEVKLTGGTVQTQGSQSYGLFSQGASITGDSGLAITTDGENGVGAYASRGGNITLTDTTVTTGSATTAGGIGLMAATDGAINATTVTVTTNGNSAAAVNAQQGTITIADSTINTVGTNSEGLLSQAGSIDATNVNVTTTGNNSAAASAALGSVKLTGGMLNTTGTSSAGIFAPINGTVDASDVTVTTKGDDSSAVSATASTITLKGSELSTAGAGSHGIFASAGSQVDANNVNATTEGEGSHALLVNQGTISLNTGSLTTKGNAAAIFVTGKDFSQPNAAQNVAINSRAIQQASEVNLTSVTVDSAQAAVQSKGGMLNLNTTGTTLNSATGLVLDAHTDDADPSVLSTINIKADSSILNGSLVSDNTQNTTHVALSNASSLKGYAKDITSVTLDDSSRWDMTESSNVQSLTNNGIITFSEPTNGAYKTLTVNGDYTGNGGTLIMNTLLGDDSSPTDQLIVTGDVKEGDTKVTINNMGGKGAYTVEGIKVVDVGGTSYGTFTSTGRIVAGAYDYNLEKQNQSWYLTNKAPVIPEPVEPEEPDNPDNPNNPDNPDNPNNPDNPDNPDNPNKPDTPDNSGDNGSVNPPVIPVPDPDKGISQIRPESGSYLANQQAANTMFEHRMQDRLGEVSYARTAEGAHADGVWMRHVASHNRFTDSSGQLKTQTNRYVLQLGADLVEGSTDGSDRWLVGVMGGYGNAQSNTRSNLTGYRSYGKVEGYSAGIYATWLQSAQNMNGAYVDTWVLYNWFNNTVNGEQLASEHYHSKGITASVEAGYTLPLTQGVNTSSFLQPKAQLTWMDVTANKHHEHNGTWVTDNTEGMLASRLGVRAYLKGHSSLDNNTGRDFQPFVEANWIHNFNDYSVKMDDITNHIAGNENIGELKVGVEGKLATDFTMWGNVAQQLGDAGYSDTTVIVGARLNF